MCKAEFTQGPCLNYKCRHNLFWTGLKLNMDRIHITGKALRISNCCRLINDPWTTEEIAEIWGISKKTIEHFEESGRRKLLRRSHIKPGNVDDRTGCRQRHSPAREIERGLMRKSMVIPQQRLGD